MKGFKKLAAVILGIVMVFGVLQVPAKAEAASAQHFNFVYDTVNGVWAYQIDGGSWLTGRDYLKEHFKDGDIIGIFGAAGAPELTIEVNARVGEIGCSTATAKVFAPGFDYGYAVENSTLIINGDVKKAVCYPGSVLQINGNCEDFTAVYKDDNSAYPVYAVTGTVTKATVKCTESVYTPTTIYSIPAGKFISSTSGGAWLEKTDYKTTAPATTTTGNKNTGNKKGELDDVPKTGSGMACSVVFFLLSAGCAAVGVAFKKREEVK